MSTLVMVKHNGGLIPADDAAADTLRSVKQGREVLVEVKTPRSPRQHRLFFALLNLLVENGETFPTVDAALTAIKIGLGECEPVINAATGEVVYVTRSIAFASCDQTRFAKLFDDATKLIADRWLRTAPDALRQRVYEMVDGPAMSSLGRRFA